MKAKSMDEVEPSNPKNQPGGWSELPQELLEIIVAHLRFGDHAGFAAVCTSWRSVAIKTRHHNALRLPWLIHSDDDRTFSDDGRTFSKASCFEDFNELHPIIPLQGNCIGCCEGWMVMENATSSGEIRLVNPLSGRYIPLPNRFKYPHTARDLESRIFNKAVLSSSPFSGTCVVVACMYAELKLALCRPFDDAWVLFPSDRQAFDTIFIEDIIFHHGLLYAVNLDCQVVVYRFPNNPQQQDLYAEVVRVYNANIPWDSSAVRLYLVWSTEKLFMAAKYCLWENNGNIRLLFGVFVLDLERKEWMEVNCLDGNMLFLSNNCSRFYKIDQNSSRFYKVDQNSSSGGYSGGHIYYIGNGIYDVYSLKNWGAPLVPQSLRLSRDTRAEHCWFVLN